ncbi:MAG: hypothetical protein BWY75_03783 [bacterium ADurb.Bin425]|nr:MAG: hypothetical protein BWY75_03783 [bacterium ADurb.Bin425]
MQKVVANLSRQNTIANGQSGIERRGAHLYLLDGGGQLRTLGSKARRQTSRTKDTNLPEKLIATSPSTRLCSSICSIWICSNLICRSSSSSTWFTSRLGSSRLRTSSAGLNLNYTLSIARQKTKSSQQSHHQNFNRKRSRKKPRKHSTMRSRNHARS